MSFNVIRTVGRPGVKGLLRFLRFFPTPVNPPEVVGRTKGGDSAGLTMSFSKQKSEAERAENRGRKPVPYA
jgi:hypothetical protein